ncbi:unnamed protein product [Closterium sp. NIES-53]
MASLRVLAFDHEGKPIQFYTWLDDLQLYLQSDSKDSVSLFDLASRTATAPPATADSATRSQTAQALYATIVARYSSPATATLGRLLLPYLFPELLAFATVEDLVSHLRTSDARYRATVPAEFLDRNQPPMSITLYFIITRIPDSLRSVRDHFLSLDPTSLTVDLLEQHLLAAETSAVAVGAARGSPRPPFFEWCSHFPLAPSYASAAAADVSVAEDVGAASASAKRRSSKGKGGRGGGGGSGGGGGGSGSGGGGSSGGSGGGGGGGGGGTGGGSGGSGGGGGGSGGSGGSGGGGNRGGRTGPRHGGPGGGQWQQQQRQSETQNLHTQHHCFFSLDDAWRAEFGDDVELPRWADLLRSRIAIFDLDFDAILSAMYALSVSAEGDCYRCVLPDPGIAAAALGAIESGTLPSTAPAQALHTFTLGSGASRCFFRDSTTLTPLPIRLADPSGSPVVARSSTVLPCPAVPSGSLSGLHLPSFSTNLDLPVLRLHSDRGGEFTSNLLRDFCRGEGILQSFTLLDSTQQNGIAEHRIGLVMEVARTSMIHAAAPHFLWPFAVRYAAHKLNLWPRVSLPETSPTLRWTGEVGDASVFRDVTFDESVPFYRLFPYRSAPLPPPPLFLAPGPPPIDPLPPQGPAPSSVSQVDPLPGTAPVEVAVGSGAARGATSEGAASGGAEPGGCGGVEPGGAESEGEESWGANPPGAASSGGPAATGAGGAGDAGARGAGVTAGASGTGGIAAAGPGSGHKAISHAGL